MYHIGTQLTENTLEVMQLIDERHLQYQVYGSRRLRNWLKERGHVAIRKRVQRLLRLMGLRTIYPWQKTSHGGTGHRAYPYALRDVTITRPNHVWADTAYRSEEMETRLRESSSGTRLIGRGIAISVLKSNRFNWLRNIF